MKYKCVGFGLLWWFGLKWLVASVLVLVLVLILVLRGKLVRLIQTRVKFVFIMWLKLTTASCPNGRSLLARRTTSAHPRGPPLWLIISRPLVLKPTWKSKEVSELLEPTWKSKAQYFFVFNFIFPVHVKVYLPQPKKKKC